MKRVLIALLCLLSASAIAEESSGTNLWFSVGEILHYKMKWGFFTIGRSRVETEEIDTGGKKLIAIRYYVKTNNIFKKIYPVDDFIETLVDPDGFVPVTYTKKINRGSPQCDEVVVFDRANGVANWYSECKVENGSFDIDDETRDLVSWLYLLRKNPLETGQVISNQVVASHSLTPISLKIGEKEKLDVAGIDDVECFAIIPVAKLDDLLVEEGEVKVWISNDSRRIVTRMYIDAAFGTVKIKLCSVEGPGDDRWSKSDQDCAKDAKEAKKSEEKDAADKEDEDSE
jgi:hypothetical protein